jgi:hypothetical protein
MSNASTTREIQKKKRKPVYGKCAGHKNIFRNTDLLSGGCTYLKRRNDVGLLNMILSSKKI